MADIKITQLNSVSSVALTDIMPVVTDPSGTAVTKKITVANLLASAYPVGSIFTSTSSTNPGTSLGFGTWSAFGAGKVLVGLDSGDTSFDTVEETGGTKTVASTGTVSQPTFTGDALGTHTHAFTGNALSGGTRKGGTSNPASIIENNASVAGSNSSVSAGTPTGTVSQPTYTGNATSVVQPYIVVYFFKRTA